jgi:hypothetical protein
MQSTVSSSWIILTVYKGRVLSIYVRDPTTLLWFSLLFRRFQNPSYHAQLYPLINYYIKQWAVALHVPHVHHEREFNRSFYALGTDTSNLSGTQNLIIDQVQRLN